MTPLNKNTVEKHLLGKERTMNTWDKYMTPEYIFKENGKEYYYMRFTGWDKMESEWQIITIKKAKEQL